MFRLFGLFNWILLCSFNLCYGSDNNYFKELFGDIRLIHSPSNNSQLHYVRNNTNSTSSILLFHQNISLPDIGDNYSYFLCFQLFHEHYNETNMNVSLKNETDLKCYKTIPNYPFNITELTNGTYHIKTSLLLVSDSNIKDIIVIKKELTTFYIKEMIEFHATYHWSKINDYHIVLNGLDVKMDIGNNSNSNNTKNRNTKIVKIPTEWVLQIFVSPSFRLLWLLVSKSTNVYSIKYEISKHTGIDYGCIDIVKEYNINETQILSNYDTIESVDWFYNKYNIFVSINPSSFCLPQLCALGYLNKEEKLLNESTECDYKTIEYRRLYTQNKGKMWVDLTHGIDFILTLPPNY